MALPPEPSQSPLMQTLGWTFRPLAFMDRNRKALGDAFSVRFVGFERPMVLVSHPEVVKALYTERRNGLPPGRSFSLEPILGRRSVLLLEGEEHMARRRLMLPAFHGERMRSYEGVVGEIVTAEIDSWPLGNEFQIHSRMQAVTLEVILRAVFGVAEGPRLDRLRMMLRRHPFPDRLPRRPAAPAVARRWGGGNPLEAVQARLAKVDETLFAEIAEHRRRPDLEERDDILSMLMTAHFEDGAAMDDKELRDQLMTLLLAGHETTATALAWTFDLLLRHPAELGRLRDSLEPGTRSTCNATIAESLRLRPVVPLAGRRLAEDLVTDASSCPPAPTSPRRSGLSTPGPSPTRIRSPSGPSASSTSRPTPTPGSPTAAASAAASAPPSPSSRCGSRCARCSPAASSARPTRAPSAPAAATSPSRRAPVPRSWSSRAPPRARSPYPRP